MKKSLLLITAMLVVLASAMAAYFEKLPYTIAQPDGKKISCFVTGDEFFNWIHDADDYTIIQAPDGYYYYAEQNGDLVQPSKYLVNSVNPATVGLIKGVRISKTEYKRKKDSMLSYQAASVIGPGNAPQSGAMNNVVVYIRFSDETEFTTTRGTYDNYLSPSTGVSLKSYFQEVSYNNLTISSTHYPACAVTTNLSYQDSHSRSYFQPYNATTNTNGYTGGSNGTDRTNREHKLLVDAINWININSPVPASLNLDGDGDGNVDNVCFIVKGSSGGWAELIWAHRWSLFSQTVNINGKRVYGYTFQPENQVQVSTLCHEMFHALGSPDLYHYTNQGVISPVGSWDLMESGSGHMLAYMKWKYSNNVWISSIPEITTTGTYTLNPVTSPTNNCFKIASPYSTDEFFVAEYRNKSGTFEGNIPGSGLIVYRIDTRETGNADGPPDEVYVYRPNGTKTVNGTTSTAYLSSTVGRTAINDATNPTSFLQNGSVGGLNISNVTAAGATISFNVTFPVACTPPTKQSTAFTSSAITDNTMSAGWTRGNGDAVLVIARAGSPVTSGPIAGGNYTANSAFGSGTQIGTGNYVVYNGSATSVNMTALASGTTYYYAIYEYFSATKCYSTPPLTGNVTTTGIPPYCAAGSPATSDEYISNVTIGAMNQASGRGTSGYQNFTSQVIPMQIGANYSATITVTIPYPSDQILIWVDWNHDGDFTDAGENVYSSTGSGFTTPHTTANFAPPAGAAIGTTVMRIRLQDSDYPNSTPCGDASFGEVEDYTINVSGGCTPPSAPTGTAAQTFCSGTAPTIASLIATGTDIKWYTALTDGTLLATTTPLANGTHYYASQTISSCESTLRLDVMATVTTNPTAPTLGTITQPTCALATGSVILNGLPASGTWTLTRTPGATATTGTGVSSTISELTANTYTYTVANAEGCISGSSANVLINAQPATPAAPTGSVTHSFCPGATVASLAASGTAIQWYAAATGGTALATTTVLINGASYYASQTIGCESTARLNVTATILAAPTAPTVGTITQPTCVTATGSVILNGLPAIGSWTLTRTPGETVATGTGVTSTISGLAATTYTYTVANAEGCISGSSANVLINAQPATPAAPTGSAAQSFCPGATVASLVATGTTIQWFASATGGTALATTTVLVNGTHYYASQTIDCESTARLNVTATILTAPTAPTVGTVTQPTCASATGNVILNGLPSTGTWTLTRTPGAETTTGTGATSTITGLVTGTYTYKVTNASGCVSSASANVVINTQPIQTSPTVGTITQPTCAVATGSVRLSGLPSSGTWTLTRTPGATVTTGTGTTSTITGLTTGTYTYTVKNSSGCTSVASANVVITVQPSPPAGPTGTTTQTFCSGTTVVSLVATGTAIKWYAAATGGTALATTTALVNGTHYYASQTVSTCESVTRLNVTATVNALPATPAAIGGTKSVCIGKTTTLTDATTGGVWSSSSTAIATISTTGVVTGVAAGSATITYKVTNASGCSRSVTTNVTVSAVPAQPGNFTTSTSAVTRGTTRYTYTVPSVSGVTYRWSYSGTGATITGTTNSVRIVYSTTATLGSLSVTASNTAGCTSTARTLAISFLKSAEIPIDIQAAVEMPVSISDLTVAKNELKVYPNPTSGQATFEFGITENARVTLDIYSITGQHIDRIFDASMDAGIKQKVLFDQSLSTGTYPCIMRWNNQMITVKLIITQ